MLGLVENLVRGAVFNDVTGIHDGYSLAHTCNNA